MIDPATDPPIEMGPIPYEIPSVGPLWANHTADPLLDPHAFDAFRNQDFLCTARDMLLATNDRTGTLILNHVAKLCRERWIEAAQRFVAGDIDGAVAIWNKHPEHGVTRSIEKIGAGTYLLTQSNGLKYTLNQEEKLAWLRSLHVVLLQSAERGSALSH